MTLAKAAMFLKGEQIHAGLWAGHGFVKPTMDFASREYAFEGLGNSGREGERGARLYSG